MPRRIVQLQSKSSWHVFTSWRCCSVVGLILREFQSFECFQLGQRRTFKTLMTMRVEAQSTVLMRKSLRSLCHALFFVALLAAPTRAVRGQELQPVLEEGRPAIKFGDHKQCSSTISYQQQQEQSLSVSVLHWLGARIEDIGTLSSSQAGIIYRTGDARHSFTVPRPMVISINNGIYFLTITTGEKKHEQFSLTCGANPDVFMYVSMLMNDFRAGLTSFQKLTAANIPSNTTRSAENQPSAPQPTQPMKTEVKVPSAEKLVTWEQGRPDSDLIVVEGSWIHILFDQDLVVAVAIKDEGGYYIADLSVLNNRKTRALVDPSASRLVLVDAIGKQRSLAPVEPGKIAKKIQRRTMWANVLRAFAAGMATKQVTSTSQTNGSVSVFGTEGSAQGIYSGTTTTTTTVPDTEAQRNAVIANARAMEDAKSRGEGIVRNAMRANTLFPKSTLEGIVYFERKKSARAMFQIRIEETLYEFSFDFSPKK
jgi:hypothetical protein